MCLLEDRLLILCSLLNFGFSKCSGCRIWQILRGLCSHNSDDTYHTCCSNHKIFLSWRSHSQRNQDNLNLQPSPSNLPLVFYPPSVWPSPSQPNHASCCILHPFVFGSDLRNRTCLVQVLRIFSLTTTTTHTSPTYSETHINDFVACWLPLLLTRTSCGVP